MLVEPPQLFLRGRIVPQEDRLQPNRAQRPGEGDSHPPLVGFNDLRTAAANINQKDSFVRMRPSSLDAKVDQARLLLPRDRLDLNTGSTGSGVEKLVAVVRIPNRGGRHGSDRHRLGGPPFSCHAGQHATDGVDRLAADAPVWKTLSPSRVTWQAFDDGRQTASRFGIRTM